MPRFYFHIFDPDEIRDEEGTDRADAADAREAALVAARDMICEQVRHGHIDLHPRIEIEDEGGKPVLTVAFAEAVSIEA